MSIISLLTDNNYPLKIKDLTVVNLDTATLNTDDFTVGGIQPKGTILASNGTKMANQAAGADGFLLTSRPAQPNGVAWESPFAGDGNIYNNDGTLVANRVLDGNAKNLSFDNLSLFIQGTPTLRQQQGTSNADDVLSDFGVGDGKIDHQINFLTYLDSQNSGGVITQTNLNADNASVELSINTINLNAPTVTKQGNAVVSSISLSSIDNQIARFDLTSGSVIQTSGALIDDTGAVISQERFYAKNLVSAATAAVYRVTDQGALQIINPTGDIVQPLELDITDASLGAAFTASLDTKLRAANLQTAAANYVGIRINSAAPKGSLGLVGDSAEYKPLAVGTNGQVLTADSAQTLGVKWATPASDINIYSTDGTIPAATTRTVSAGDAASKVTFNPIVDFAGTLTKSGAAAQGDLLKGSGTSFNSFAKGAALNTLRVNTGGTDLEWTITGLSTGTDSLAFGNGAVASATNSGAFGTSASASQSNSWALGASSNASGSQAMSIGAFSDATGINSLAFGTLAQSTNSNTTALGANSSATGARAIAIASQTAGGFGASGSDSISIGNRAEATNANSIAIGQNCVASQIDSIALGRAATTDIAGRFSVNPAATATTVGAAGGGSALPATPVTYWRVRIGEVNYKIPLFNE